jgi:hypothetical protein
MIAALRHANGDTYLHPEAVAQAVRKLRRRAYRTACQRFGLVLDVRTVDDCPDDFRLIAVSIRLPD